MTTILLLPPAALAYCQSQIGRDGARRHAQSNQEIEATAAILLAYYDDHHMLVRTGSHLIARVKADHGQYRATSTSTNSP
jgi:hypothetical protein